MNGQNVHTGSLSRRAFVQGAGVASLGLLAGCALPWQTAAKLPRIGYLAPRSDPTVEDGLREGLREHGYVEGQNLTLVHRIGEGDPRPLAELAAELVRLRVDVIVALNNPSAVAARQATDALPIVMMLGDPIGTGLAASLGRPGGNVTGLTNLAPLLGAKRLDLLKETIPGLARVAVLWTPYNPVKRAEWTEVESAGRTLGLTLQSLEWAGPEDLEGAFAAASREHASAVIVFGDNLASVHAPRIAELATKRQLPTMYESRLGLDLGGLIAYGPSFSALYRRSAYYVDRILKGAKPADLPIEQPREFDLVINLKTAQALGLTIPQHVLLQATEIIQ